MSEERTNEYGVLIDADNEVIYCALCEAEAMKRTEAELPLCSTCYEAYKWGVAAGEENAAAPELLAACKAVRQRMVGLRAMQAMSNAAKNGIKQELENLDAVIDKAEGKP